MTWQTAMALQIIVSSFMTLFTRRLTLRLGKVFFSVGVLSYLAIAVAGTFYTVTFGHRLAAMPSASAWPYLLIEGICIPASWLVSYQLIRYMGAANAVIVTSVNTVMTATLGIIALGEPATLAFAIGTLAIIAGTLAALGIKPDENHKNRLKLGVKLALIIAGALLYALGMFAEKKAINIAGVWNYTTFGWGMQAVGALVLFIIFGFKEWSKLSKKTIVGGLVLGLITSVAGLLYVYALSKGELSRTIVAASGKVALTFVLAALIMRERNALAFRLAALTLSVIGLILII